MLAVHHKAAWNSTRTVKALSDGDRGTLAGPWYMAAGCSPETHTEIKKLSKAPAS
jgi:hypothetical protein